MFSPRFVITNKILLSIVELEKAALIVDLAPLEIDWENKLKLESVGRRAGAVMRYDENQLSPDDIVKIVKDDPGRDDKPASVAVRSGVVAREMDVQSLMNWLNANKLVSQTAYLSHKFKQSTFALKDIVSLNSLLGERVVDSNSLGRFREGVAREIERNKSPLAIEVSYQIEDLFSWFGGLGKNEYHPVVKAGIMLFELMRIQPFQENNVVTSIFFFGLLTASDGYGFKDIWSFEEDVLRNKPKFWEMISQTTENGDLTGWLEYLTRLLAESAEKIKVKIMNLIGDRPVFKSEMGKAISLTERQIVIMEEITIQNEMAIKEIRAILPMVSDDTILRDLKDLMGKKLIKKKGKTKGAIYVLGKVKGFK